jgi:hypothetical protein
MVTAAHMLLFGNNQCTVGSAIHDRNADCMLLAAWNMLILKTLRRFPGSIAGLASPLLPLVGRFCKPSHIAGKLVTTRIRQP